MTGWDQDQGVRREGNAVVLSQDSSQGVSPASPSDVQRWLQDDQTQAIVLTSPRDDIKLATWH